MRGAHSSEAAAHEGGAREVSRLEPIGDKDGRPVERPRKANELAREGHRWHGSSKQSGDRRRRKARRHQRVEANGVWAELGGVRGVVQIDEVSRYAQHCSTADELALEAVLRRWPSGGGRRGRHICDTATPRGRKTKLQSLL